MRVISIRTLREFWRIRRDAQNPLKDWFDIAEAAHWRNFMEVRRTFAHADTAVVRSGNTVTIFDIGGNKYRLIASIHYNTGTVYALMVLTHAEYDTQTWKTRL